MTEARERELRRLMASITIAVIKAAPASLPGDILVERRKFIAVALDAAAEESNGAQVNQTGGTIPAV